MFILLLKYEKTSRSFRRMITYERCFALKTRSYTVRVYIYILYIYMYIIYIYIHVYTVHIHMKACLPKISVAQRQQNAATSPGKKCADQYGDWFGIPIIYHQGNVFQIHK